MPETRPPKQAGIEVNVLILALFIALAIESWHEVAYRIRRRR